MYVLTQFTRTQVWQQSIVWAFCFQSVNLYGPWFVFTTECDFDNTDIEGTPIELRHITRILTHGSMKRLLNPLNHQFRKCDSRSSAGVPAIVYSCATLIKSRNILMINKTCKEISNRAGKGVYFIVRSVNHNQFVCGFLSQNNIYFIIYEKPTTCFGHYKRPSLGCTF
jgi:hypothetical protein